MTNNTIVMYEKPLEHESKTRDWCARCGTAEVFFFPGTHYEIEIYCGGYGPASIPGGSATERAQHLRNLAQACIHAACVLEGTMRPDEPKGNAT